MLRNKRKRVAALLAGCMVIGSSMSVYAGTASGYVGKQRTHLNVTVRYAYASTGGNNAKTSIAAKRYVTGGSMNQMVAMPTQTGANELTVYAPNGWDIGTATSFHTYEGATSNLTAHS